MIVGNQNYEGQMEYGSIGRNGKMRVTVRLPSGETYTDKVDIADARDRQRFVRGLVKEKKGIDKKTVLAELERRAGELPTDGDSGRPSQADCMVELCNAVELFHTPGGLDSEAYATIAMGNHKETWLLGSKGFRCWLSSEYYKAHGKAPGSQAIEDAISTLKGKALHDGPELAVAVRVASHGDAIYFDLANQDWEVVEITAAGWRVMKDSPVRFVRKRGQLPLPTPIPGGRLEELRPLLNLKKDENWILLVAWLVAALRPGRPFPILSVNGEQGSAKSTLCKMARALIDPNKAPLRRPPREERDLMIAAINGWVVAFDNLSGIPAALSDALCTLATGGGFSARELYTDADEKLFDATRPVLMNGIEDLATRSDLLDRCLCLTLPTIADSERQEEEALWERFEEIRPRVLGALLNAVVAALNNKNKVTLTSKPRMADFAAWIVAAEPALGWSVGKFLETYTANRSLANRLVVDTSVLAAPILALVESEPFWLGTANELLHTLGDGYADERTRKDKNWPTTARKLTGELRRLAPNLRRLGVEVKFADEIPNGHTKKGNLIQLERSRKTPSQHSQPSRPVYETPADHWLGEDGERGERVLQPCSESLESSEDIIEWTA